MNGSGRLLCRVIGDRSGMDQRIETAVGPRPDRHALFGGSPAADDAVHALAGQREPDRTAGELRRRRRQHLVLPQRLAAEPAADERREDPYLLLSEAEDLCHRPGHVRHALQHASCIKSVSPSQARVTACSSIALWLCRGVA